MNIRELIIDYKVDKMNFDKLEDKIINEKREIHLFVQDGVIIVTPSNMVKKMYNFTKPSYIIENYYKDISIIVNENKMTYKKVTHIPVTFEERNVVKTIYKTHRRSKVSLVYEVYDKTIEKAYFLVDGDEEDFMIKEDICSLLQAIM